MSKTCQEHVRKQGDEYISKEGIQIITEILTGERGKRKQDIRV